MLKLLLVLGLLVAVSLACFTYQDTDPKDDGGDGGDDTVVITKPPPPILPPPTPSPTAPPPPPPYPEGWVPLPPRTLDQVETRPNCERYLTWGVQDNEIQEKWNYDCTFQVYYEINLFESNQVTDCGCGLSYDRQVPPEDPNYDRARKTIITQFDLVVWDAQANKVVDVFPSEFQFLPDTNMTNELKFQLEQESMTSSRNYDRAVMGFTGKFSTANLPNRLNQDNPANANNVPAMCFTVLERLQSSAKWPEPSLPTLYTSPNTWWTECTSFYEGSFTYKRQQEETRYWFREFLTFPDDKTAGLTVSGFKPNSRYMTSYYRDSQCTKRGGVVTFDREFTYQIQRDRRDKLYGAFMITRTYSAMYLVGGVPTQFEASAHLFEAGFARAHWIESYARDNQGEGSYRVGVLYHALLPRSSWAGGDMGGALPFDEFKDNMALCRQLPASWETCSPGDADCPIQQRVQAYGEDAYFFPATDENGQLLADFDCAPAAFYCGTDKTYLAFQNFNELARDFNKRTDSWMYTGPRDDFCNPNAANGPTRDLFDNLIFQPYHESTVLRKRNLGTREAKRIADRKATIRYTKRGEIVPEHGQPGDPPYEGMEPNPEDVTVKAMAGSSDGAGGAGGDHPVQLFPETYTVPISLNPEHLDFDVTKGGKWEAPIACLQGSKGCGCREIDGRPPCDAPYVCNKGASGAFCDLPVCLDGQAGCSCNADGSCGDDSLECSDNTCVFKQVCTDGADGCRCRLPAVPGSQPSGTPQYPEIKCTNPEADCITGLLDLPNPLEGVCLVKSCPAGLNGCPCLESNACLDNSATCTAGVCTVADGAANQKGSPCQGETCVPGATCQNGFCTGTACTPGSSGCICADGNVCNSATDSCTGGMCVSPRCEQGDGGCTCAIVPLFNQATEQYVGLSGRCRSGFVCNNPRPTDYDARCTKEQCPPGTSGCPCLAGNQCKQDGFACRKFDDLGDDMRCVATGVSCTNQQERCKKFCGAGNVKSCPACSNVLPRCFNEPGAAGDDSGASSLAVSAFAVAALLVAGIF